MWSVLLEREKIGFKFEACDFGDRIYLVPTHSMNPSSEHALASNVRLYNLVPISIDFFQLLLVFEIHFKSKFIIGVIINTRMLLLDITKLRVCLNVIISESSCLM